MTDQSGSIVALLGADAGRDRDAVRTLLRRAACWGVLSCLIGGSTAQAVVITPGHEAQVEFRTTDLTGPTAAGAAPLFEQRLNPNIQGANALVGPGRGFRSIDNTLNTYFNPGAGPLPVATGIETDPVFGLQAATTLEAVGTFIGGGGFVFLSPTGARDPLDQAIGGDLFTSVNVTRAFGAFVNPSPVFVPTITGMVVGISGFLPTGAFGAIALTGSIFVPGTGLSIVLDPIVIAIDGVGGVGSDGVFVNGADFVMADGLVVPANTLSPSPLLDLEVTPVAGGAFFSGYGVSLGPGLLFPPFSAPAQAELTLTVIADPGASIFIDPSVIPAGIPLPDFGGGDRNFADAVAASAIPEPSTLTLLGLGGLGLFGYGRRRRKK